MDVNQNLFKLGRNIYKRYENNLTKRKIGFCEAKIGGFHMEKQSVNARLNYNH